MRLQGQKIEGPNIEEIIIPRGNDALVFKAQAILSYDEFDALCPRPKAQVSVGKGGKRVERTDAPKYVDAINTWAEQRVAWMILKSLDATPDLIWDTLDLNDPSTWLNYKEEFKSSGFSEAEQVRLITGVMAANGLDEGKVEAARDSFLALRQAELENLSSPTDELSDTPSGVPAKG